MNAETISFVLEESLERGESEVRSILARAFSPPILS